MLEFFIRNTLNDVSKRVMAVINPINLVITNYSGEEDIVLEDYPQKENSSTRTYPFGKNLLIEREDFEILPPPKYHRLYVGNKVRLKGAYVVECTGYDLNEDGSVKTVYATYDPSTKSGEGSEVKVKGTIHWLNTNHAKQCEVRLFENLLSEEDEGSTNERAIKDEFIINPNSVQIIKNAYVEDLDYKPEERYQFIRNGYFCLDKDTTKDNLVFNRTVSLKDTKLKKVSN